MLGANIDTGPVLSFPKTEQAYRTELEANGFQIRRVWDVDSFLSRITTLAVHKGGINLAYRPPYLHRITQNPRVLFAGKKIHKLKQLRIGTGIRSAGFGFSCSIFFPEMPVTQDTHLSTEEQRSWIDNIILPALRASCPDDVLQHHPRSFNEVLRKAGIQGENTLHGQHQDLDLRYCVPERCLNEFSNQVLHRCNNQAGYQNAFYVISAHNLKLTTKRPSLLQCRTDFINILTQYFEYSSVTFPTVDCWLDLGHEDTPSATTGHAVTLLRKRACLSAWSKLFSCPKSSAHHLACDTYPWAGTWMAGTATTTLKEQNSLHTVMSYNKSYNLHKNIFTTPLKNYLPFDNPQFEALSYSAELITEWA